MNTRKTLRKMNTDKPQAERCPDCKVKGLMKYSFETCVWTCDNCQFDTEARLGDFEADDGIPPQKPAHGGVRKGSGRKAVAVSRKCHAVAASLPQWIIDKLPVEGRSATIQAALVEYLKITPPID